MTITGIYADNQLFNNWIVSDDTLRALVPANEIIQDVGVVARGSRART